METGSGKVVALGLNQAGELQVDHFGDSAVYGIYQEDGFLIEERYNPLYAEHKHAKAEEILQVLPDCTVWAGKSMGKRSREVLEQRGIRTVLITSVTRKDAVDEILCLLSDEGVER